METTGEVTAPTGAELLEKADKIEAAEILLAGAPYQLAHSTSRLMRKLAAAPAEVDKAEIAKALEQLQHLSSSVPRMARERMVEAARTLEKMLR